MSRQPSVYTQTHLFTPPVRGGKGTFGIPVKRHPTVQATANTRSPSLSSILSRVRPLCLGVNGFAASNLKPLLRPGSGALQSAAKGHGRENADLGPLSSLSLSPHLSLFFPLFLSFFHHPFATTVSERIQKIKTSTKHLTQTTDPDFAGVSWTPSRNRPSLGTRPPAPER